MAHDRGVAVSTLMLAFLCLALALGACADGSGAGNGYDIDWGLTLVGADGEGEVVLSFDELTAMPFYEGWGGFFTTVGVVNGPYRARGVPLEDLCAIVGGVGLEDVVRVSAPDGYSMVFSYSQLHGGFTAYDPDTLTEVADVELTPILMYAQDDMPLSEDAGTPLRVAIVGEEAVLTEGHYWVKWVAEIEVLDFD